MKVIETYFVTDISKPFGDTVKTIKKAYLLDDNQTIILETQGKMVFYDVITKDQLDKLIINGI